MIQMIAVVFHFCKTVSCMRVFSEVFKCRAAEAFSRVSMGLARASERVLHPDRERLQLGVARARAELLVEAMTVGAIIEVTGVCRWRRRREHYRHRRYRYTTACVT